MTTNPEKGRVQHLFLLHPAILPLLSSNAYYLHRPISPTYIIIDISLPNTPDDLSPFRAVPLPHPNLFVFIPTRQFYHPSTSRSRDRNNNLLKPQVRSLERFRFLDPSHGPPGSYLLLPFTLLPGFHVLSTIFINIVRIDGFSRFARLSSRA